MYFVVYQKSYYRRMLYLKQMQFSVPLCWEPGLSVSCCIFYVSFRDRIFLTDLSRDVVCRTAAIVASQPFTVIAVRMMAQFVGGENKYW